MLRSRQRSPGAAVFRTAPTVLRRVHRAGTQEWLLQPDQATEASVGCLPRAISIAAACLILSGALGLLVATEHAPPRLWFAAALTIAIAAALTFATRRLMFASAATLVLVGGILLVSRTKMSAMNMALHSYDAFFYLNAPTLGFLWESYPAYLVSAAALVLSAALVLALCWRFDRSECPRILAIAACIVMGAVATWIETWPSGLAFEFTDARNANVSSYYLTWPATAEAIARGQPLEAAASTALPPFVPLSGCTTTTAPPHILLIHQESLVQPSLFPQLEYDHGLDRFFLSDDGDLHPLRVETYGGASWVTDFSLMAGISSRFFGSLRTFVQVFTTGKLTETLPQSLKNCDYRNMLFFPFDAHFLAHDKFYKSIGFDEVFDRRAQGITAIHERDRVYFENALSAIDRHLRVSGAPFFVYVQTMTAHGPYSFKYLPGEDVAGGGPGTPPAMSEYLRRAAIVQRDGEWLIEQLKRRFPTQRILIIRFGDHHPTATFELLPSEAKDERSTTSSRFTTFYAIKGHNLVVPRLPSYDAVDVPYLGNIILEAAGLPLSEAQKHRRALMQACAGNYFSCERRDEILAFHRRLIQSDLIRSP
jgi:phosphoglycerol transferase MdoB-like AlkP superfamily enzyme